MVKETLKKLWHFIWHEDSLLSWVVNLILAFVLVKWVIYPFLGLIFSTHFPIVAVVSSSMEHRGKGFDTWWEDNKEWYETQGITKAQFITFPFKNGFNKGDIMILHGVKAQDVALGNVVVYEGQQFSNPIIHRVVKKELTNGYLFTTKGDNNKDQDQEAVHAEQIARTGKAVLRIPFLGWIKIWFVDLVGIVK